MFLFLKASILCKELFLQRTTPTFISTLHICKEPQSRSDLFLTFLWSFLILDECPKSFVPFFLKYNWNDDFFQKVRSFLSNNHRPQLDNDFFFLLVFFCLEHEGIILKLFCVYLSQFSFLQIFSIQSFPLVQIFLIPSFPLFQILYLKGFPLHYFRLQLELHVVLRSIVDS